jgi:ABC-type phosphate transport system substrate-binding protein
LSQHLSNMKQLMFCVLVVLETVFVASASSGEVAVIAHPSVPVNTISRSHLLDIYVGDVKEWDNGEPIVVVDLKPMSGVKEAFYMYLGKSSSRIKSIWMKQLLTGEGQPPEAMESQQTILEIVAATPGAIGYVDRSLVTGAVVTLAVIPPSDGK